MHTMKHPVSAMLLMAGSLNVVLGYHVVETKMTQTDASQYCSDHFGSTLATFTNDAEALELRGLMDASSQNNFWNGINDKASEGTYVFESGYDCGGNCKDLSQWNPGEPNNSGNNEDCTHFWPSGTTFKMNDLRCDYSGLAFICDEAATTAAPTADPTTSPTMDPTADPTVEPTEFHCSTHGCDQLTVCDAASGRCMRDCDVLHIDEFLTDCSVEWDSQETTITALSTDIATNTEGIKSNDADIAANAADIATVTNAANDNEADITSLETRMDSVESTLEAIQLVLDKLEVFGAHSSMIDVDAMTAADLVDDGSWTAVTLSGKDVAIVSMLAVNVVLMTSMAIVCCRKQRGVQKYQAVSIASD